MAVVSDSSFAMAKESKAMTSTAMVLGYEAKRSIFGQSWAARGSRVVLVPSPTSPKKNVVAQPLQCLKFRKCIKFYLIPSAKQALDGKLVAA